MSVASAPTVPPRNGTFDLVTLFETLSTTGVTEKQWINVHRNTTSGKFKYHMYLWYTTNDQTNCHGAVATVRFDFDQTEPPEFIITPDYDVPFRNAHLIDPSSLTVLSIGDVPTASDETQFYATTTPTYYPVELEIRHQQGRRKLYFISRIARLDSDAGDPLASASLRGQLHIRLIPA